MIDSIVYYSICLLTPIVLAVVLWNLAHVSLLAGTILLLGFPFLPMSGLGLFLLIDKVKK